MFFHMVCQQCRNGFRVPFGKARKSQIHTILEKLERIFRIHNLAEKGRISNSLQKLAFLFNRQLVHFSFSHLQVTWNIIIMQTLFCTMHSIERSC